MSPPLPLPTAAATHTFRWRNMCRAPARDAQNAVPRESLFVHAVAQYVCEHPLPCHDSIMLTNMNNKPTAVKMIAIKITEKRTMSPPLGAKPSSDVKSLRAWRGAAAAAQLQVPESKTKPSRHVATWHVGAAATTSIKDTRKLGAPAPRLLSATEKPSNQETEPLAPTSTATDTTSRERAMWQVGTARSRLRALSVSTQSDSRRPEQG